MNRTNHSVLANIARACFASGTEVNPLQNINLARQRPAAIDAVGGHHPYGRPGALALGRLRTKFDLSVFPAGNAKRSDFAGGIFLRLLRIRLIRKFRRQIWTRKRLFMRD